MTLSDVQLGRSEKRADRGTESRTGRGTAAFPHCLVINIKDEQMIYDWGSACV